MVTMTKELVDLFTDHSISPMIVPPTGVARQKTTLDEAIQSGVSFMVMPKWNLFIIDSDTSVQTLQYDIYRQFLVRNQVKHYEWNSGRPGHRHLVAAFHDANLQNEAYQLVQRLGLDLRHHRTTRPTCAPHKNGFDVSLVEKYTIEDVRETLRVECNSKWVRPNLDEIDFTSNLIQRPIKKSILELIQHGPPPGSDRSAAITKVALSLANANYSIDEGAKILCNPANKISAHIQKSRKNPDRQFQYARFFMKKAFNFLQKNPASLSGGPQAQEVRYQLQKIARFIQDIPWKGQTGNSDYSCLNAHLQAAIRAGSFTYGLSIREQEVTAECAMATCIKANNRLIKSGWLTRTALATRETAQVWTISIPESLRSDFQAAESRLNARDCYKAAPIAPKGIFRAVLVDGIRGLGKSAGRIFAQIALGRHQRDVLTKATGLSRWTVKRALERLERAEMVDSEAQMTGYVPEDLITYANYKELAIRTRHQREREVWKNHQRAKQIAFMRKR